jgi:hypothetical protein
MDWIGMKNDFLQQPALSSIGNGENLVSLWLQAATEALQSGDYERFRVNILPLAPISIPGCMYRELEFAERRCRDKTKDQLFPIRFLWLMEANEQRMFGLSPLGRSRYHPEKILSLWKRASAEAQYLQECEADGVQFDFNEKAMKLDVGWIFIGDRFIEDFLEVEITLGVELLFPNPSTTERLPAFQELKKQKKTERT